MFKSKTIFNCILHLTKDTYEDKNVMKCTVAIYERVSCSVCDVFICE